MKIHAVVQGSPEWHALRATTRNASEAPAMMGVSKYVSRDELVKAKATGIVNEITPALQRIFDDGHRTERAARPLVEAIIGEELYPVVATDDEEYLLASSDGSTLLGDIGYEHKLWNQGLAIAVAGGNVPESHRWQLDHQIAVFGFDKILFVVSDGTQDNFVHCEYTSTPERIAKLKTGWAQFEKDVAAYQHVEEKAAVVADAIEDLPTLSVQLSGQVVASNLVSFKTAVTERIKAINTDLVTDQDFVNAEKVVKFLGDGEDQLEQVKKHALSQTESIDVLFRTIDSLSAEMRAKRLTLEKLIAAEKTNRKNEIVLGAGVDLDKHIKDLIARVGIHFSFVHGGFAEAAKGLKSIDSMRKKVSGALALAKVESSALADRIEINMRTLKAQGDEYKGLFPDILAIITKPNGDFMDTVNARISAHKTLEAERLEAEREKIRAEEQEKFRVEAINHAAEVGLQAIAEIRRDSIVDAVTAGVGFEKTSVVDGGIAVQHIHVGQVIEDGKTIKLGDICSRLGVGITAEFLTSLGFPPVAHNKNAKLYLESSFVRICEALVNHINRAKGA